MSNISLLQQFSGAELRILARGEGLDLASRVVFPSLCRGSTHYPESPRTEHCMLVRIIVTSPYCSPAASGDSVAIERQESLMFLGASSGSQGRNKNSWTKVFMEPFSVGWYRVLELLLEAESTGHARSWSFWVERVLMQRLQVFYSMVGARH